MVVQRCPATGALQAGMYGDQVMLAIDAHGVRRGLEPERLADQLEGHRVEAFSELDLAVAVDPGLLGELRRHSR